MRPLFSIWDSAASAALSGHGVTEPAREAIRVFCTVGPDWPTPISVPRLPPRRSGTRSCFRRAFATYQPAPSFARTTPNASGSNLCGWAAPLRNRHKAQHGRIFHLWWHPHNFSQYQPENFALLETVLEEFERLAVAEGMQSLTMADVAAKVSLTPPGRVGEID